MACYVDEEEVWKCPKHPSKRRRNGICPTCLRDRLNSLCPDCHHLHPCPCVGAAAASTSSSSSILLDGEPTFRRSRSVAIPFLRSRNSYTADNRTPNINGGIKTPSNNTGGIRTPSSFMSLLRRSATKRGGLPPAKVEKKEAAAPAMNDENFDCHNRIEDYARMVTRSRSVSVGNTRVAMATGFRRSDVDSSPAKGKFWNFPSPMKAFRSSKTPKFVVQDRSALRA